MGGVKIIENFLEDNFFEDLRKLVSESEFSWFKRENMVNDNEESLGYFTHSFFNNYGVNCKYYDQFIVPILKKLNAHAAIQVRANLSPSCFYKNKKADFHVDNTYPSKTAIFYLNTCDGGTELKVDNEIKFIKAEKNKMLIFDTNTQHRGTPSKDVDFRYIINFNYY
jgi:hypothetical protein